jgi:hypothetical protein
MLGRTTLLRVVPIFVALMVWLIRVLIIGTFSVAGDNLFSMGAQPNNAYYRPVRPGYGNKPALPQNSAQAQFNRSMSASSGSFSRKPQPPNPPDAEEQPEPTYHPLSAMTSRIDHISETRPGSAPSRRF